MRNGKRLVTALSGLALIVGTGLVSSAPAQAAPDITVVQARVDKLFHQAEQASERYNQASLDLAELNRELAALEADQARQGGEFGKVRDQLQDTIVRQYEGQSLSAVGQVVVSDDPGQFLAQLSTMSAYNALQTQVFNQYATELQALQVRRKATEERKAQVEATKRTLAAEKQVIDQKYAEANALLDQLKEDERAAYYARDTVTPPTDVAVSGRAGAAVAYALAQVGDAYVYGAAGPNAFDCSGLTMMAWAQAGVSLPHSSSAQYGSGPHIPASQLQPGDLVFYYSPISHVAMYIGNGLIVHAAHPGAGVRVASLYSMPYVGAVRPG